MGGIIKLSVGTIIGITVGSVSRAPKGEQIALCYPTSGRSRHYPLNWGWRQGPAGGDVNQPYLQVKASNTDVLSSLMICNNNDQTTDP